VIIKKKNMIFLIAIASLLAGQGMYKCFSFFTELTAQPL